MTAKSTAQIVVIVVALVLGWTVGRAQTSTLDFELVVHTADLGAAIGVPTEPPPVAATQAVELVTQLAVEGGLAGPLLRAATGREGLPPGFTVL